MGSILSGGYMGRILRVNLTDGSVGEESLDYELARNFVGGAGIGSKILFDEVDPKSEPLSADNKIVFATGPLTGTRAPCSGRYAVVTKSPLTDGISDAHSGGRFPAEMKFSGFDIIIVEGASRQPLYLWVKDGKAELRDAKHLWGMNVNETTDAIISELGDPKIRVACIGRAGENQVRFACIMNDKARAPGRNGAGAVAGFKKLKAIAVRGSLRPQMADEDGFAAAAKEANIILKEFDSLAGLKEHGTASFVNPLNAFGVLPTRNFQEGQFSGADRVSGETMTAKYLKRRTACFACPIACGRWCKIEDGPYKVDSEGPEYEPLNAYCAYVGNDNIEAALKACSLCNDYGMDSISCPATIAYAFELFEKGLISAKDTGGLKLTWGDAETLVELTKMIGERKGLGAVLAEGVKRISEKIGGEAMKFAMHVKGLECPMHEPRGYKSLGLFYATSNRGACHVRPYPGVWEVFGVPFSELGLPAGVDRFSEEGKAGYVKVWQEFASFINAMDICQFVAVFPALQISHLVKMFNGATGFGFTDKDLLKTGERIHNIQRLFNVMAGMGRDTLPPRFTSESHTSGPCQGQVVNLDAMLDEYYQLRGWDKNGVPGTEKLKELGLVT